ncbi:MAG: OmcA/MtrC family decaheme c-type cytochrome [Gammaproteobacteria bacterium]|nr:OmcA/MtrC family decaheme c-type cytochrome [Gammaproteobacteria bacterium]
MTTTFANQLPWMRKIAWAGVAVAAFGLAACTGGSGGPGPQGPQGPDGPPGGGTPAAPISTANEIVARINRVTILDDGRPFVEVYLRDERGRPLTGLPAGNIRFVLARLEPAVNGKSSTWHAITRKTEAFPGSPPPTPADKVTGTGPTNQATTETATAGTWVDKQSGIFEYTFARNVKTDAEIPYDPGLPHRVGLEIRTSPNVTPKNIPANNATYTFTPATGAQLEQSGREIVDNDTCNACHDNLSAHGGARFDLQYCAMCHESYSFDAQSGNTIDLKVMIHKIHSGETLPSVEAGGFYGIFGFGNTFTDLGETVYPQDKRNCATCHQESDTDTPQASNYRLTVNAEACGSCHDNVNFATGENHGGVAATADSCSACHGPNSVVQNGELRAERAHLIPEVLAAAKFRYEVLKVANTAPGQNPTVTIRVVDPTNGDAPYDIKAADGPFQNASASLAVDVAFSTRPDYTNTGSGSATPTKGTPAQPIRIDFKVNGQPDPAFAGGFVATATAAIPATAKGSGSALIEGRPAVDVNGDGTLERLAVTSVGKDFAITDTAPVAYRQIVDIAKCNDCHQELTLHGNSRTGNAQLCATCHNPNATDINRRVAGSNCETVTGTLDDQAIDLKFMIHSIHAGAGSGYKVCGFGNTGYDFSSVRYPGKINNCEGCHLAGTYYPPDPATAIATTIDAGADRSTPLGDVAITPASAACSSCHVSSQAKLHMELNGGSFSAVKAADSTTPGAPVEACGTCHGAGKAYDVKTEHGVGKFLPN